MATTRLSPRFGPRLRRRRSLMAGAVAIGGFSLFIGALALAFPQTALDASLRGVAVWWDVLFPALFPFFVLSELMLGFGIVHMAGTLLDPLMRPLFRLPGVGGFIVAMGFASGYPVGAKLTSRLMDQKLVTRFEGERLVAMTTTSDPIFLMGAVCIGFFGSLEPAPAIAAAHYGGALLLGVAGRFLRAKPSIAPTDETVSEAEPLDATEPIAVKGGRLRAAIAAMHRARLADGRPFGILLQQSLLSSLGLMMIVGGLVVFFSAVLDLLVNSGFLLLFRDATGQMLKLIGLYPNLAPAFVNGLFEVTLGAKAAASDAAIPLVHRAAVAAFVLSWAGLSVHAQVAGLMSGTGWRYAPFARTRLVHGLLSMLLVYAVWPIFPAGSSSNAASSVIANVGTVSVPGTVVAVWQSPLSSFGLIGLTFAGVLAIVVVAGTIASVSSSIRRRRGA
ncbi:nucleoside recognition domain-containing protein [Cohnella suwonensis]|uniref:Nucleoside recognition domain-containing protein n=1 Tax=Cohnella suwonensis TaxID=696072 RepID=A0ABW0LX71_9BACL